MWVYSSERLETISFIDSNFSSNIDSRKSTFKYVFTLNGGVIC